MENKLKIIGIAGSLRKNSFNKMLLNELFSVAGENWNSQVSDIADIPLYNADVEAIGIPESVTLLGEKISNADGLIIVTPEYNYSIPGVLKNAIDWLSRLKTAPLKNKPVGILGASMSLTGTVRSQSHLRLVAVMTEMLIMNKPDVYVAQAQNKFTEDGKLNDEKTISVLKKFSDNFTNWVIKIK